MSWILKKECVQRSIRYDIVKEYSRCTLSTAGCTDQGDVRYWLNGEVQIEQHTKNRTSRVAEMDIIKADAALKVLRKLAF